MCNNDKQIHLVVSKTIIVNRKSKIQVTITLISDKA